MLVCIPQHVHRLFLRWQVGARITDSNSCHFDFRRILKNLMGQCWNVDPRVGFACDEELVGLQLWKLLEEVLHRCTICAGRGDICIVAVAACLHGCTIGVSNTSRTLQDQEVGLLGPGIRVSHEATRGIDEQGPILLQHAQDRAAARSAIQPQHHRQGGCICRFCSSEPVVELGPRFDCSGIQKARILRRRWWAIPWKIRNRFARRRRTCQRCKQRQAPHCGAF